MFINFFLSCFFLFTTCLYAHSPKIVVIGAGLSGLTTAHRLDEEGYDVEVYEARNRVGGRVFTVEIDGHFGELGAQNLLDGGDSENLLKLVEELGLETKVRGTSHSLHYYFDDGSIIDVRDRLRERAFEPQQLRAQLEMIAENSNSMEQILQALFDEEDLLYKSSSILLGGYEGGTTDKLSTFYLPTLYHILLGGYSQVHQATAKIDQAFVKEGNGKIAERMSEKLAGRVHLNRVLTSIEKNGSGYSLSFQNGQKICADILILTIPCPVYKNIKIDEAVIPREKLSFIEAVEYGSTTKILVPVLPQETNIGAHTNGRIVTFLNGDSHIVNMYYTPGYGRFCRSNLDATFRRDLPMVAKFYEVKPTQPVIARDESFASYTSAVGHSWPNDPFAGGSFSYVGVGQEEVFTSTCEIDGEIVKTLFAPIDETLFFAGEHTSILFDVSATMEAAVESGNRTARMVIKSLEEAFID